MQDSLPDIETNLKFNSSAVSAFLVGSKAAENDAYNFVYGNVINDLTWDGLVYLHYMLIASSNNPKLFNRNLE